jgi:hypothetical protein
MVTKLIEMREKVKAELKHIPKDNSIQNELRMFYWSDRMRSLGKKAKSEKTKEEVLLESIKSLKKYHPDFEPQYDKTFFNIEKV